jgi:hypothetical protein
VRSFWVDLQSLPAHLVWRCIDTVPKLGTQNRFCRDMDGVREDKSYNMGTRRHTSSVVGERLLLDNIICAVVC